MSAPPDLFDLPALDRNRRRVSELGLFLHDLARDAVEDRVSMINKSFTDVAVVTPFPQIWSLPWPQAVFTRDNEVLRLPSQNFDLIVHAMCLHWANDPVGQLIQCRRALRPDGVLFAVLLGGTTLTELRTSLQAAEAMISSGLHPRVSPMADIRDLGGLLQRAGFNMPVADSVITKVEYTDIWHLMRDLRSMGEVNALDARSRTFTKRSVFQAAADVYKTGFALPNGRIPASFEMITLTGWAPAGNQPQPLRPGSASTRLAQALGVPEIKLPD